MHYVILALIFQGIGKLHCNAGHKALIKRQIEQLRQDSVLLKKLNDEKDVKIYQLEKEVSEIHAANTRLMTKIDDMSIKMETLNRDMASLQKQLVLEEK